VEHPEDPNAENLEVKDSLYKFVGTQSKGCMRKGLGIVKQLYDKYSSVPSFLTLFSSQIYSEIIEDQLPLLT